MKLSLMRAARRAAAALLAGAFSFTGGAAQDASWPRLTAGEEVHVVFRWASQRCDFLQIPDSPARAIRMPNGDIALTAAHLNNVLLRGRDFDTLTPMCESASSGAENADPMAFNDRFWVQALAPLPDGRVLGLASHEYMGFRHPGRCAASGPGRAGVTELGAACWYSAITATVANPGEWRFRPLPLDGRLVAASPFTYDPTTPHPTGFFSITNIVFDGGFAYVMAYTHGIPGQPHGMCLLRASRDDLLGGWRALAGGEFRLRLDTSPRAHKPCDIVGAGALTGAVRSVVRLGRDGPWIAVFGGRDRGVAAHNVTHEGALYSLSPDLMQWSPPRLLMPAVLFKGQPEAGLYFQYPSLIDHASPSPVFDEASERLYLYFTRFNLLEDRRRGMDRDLVRFPVRISNARLE